MDNRHGFWGRGTEYTPGSGPHSRVLLDPWPAAVWHEERVILMKGSCLFWIEMKVFGLWRATNLLNSKSKGINELFIYQKRISSKETFYLFHIMFFFFYLVFFGRCGGYVFTSPLCLMLQMCQHVRRNIRPREKTPHQKRVQGWKTGSNKRSQQYGNPYQTSAWLTRPWTLTFDFISSLNVLFFI